MEDKGIHIDYKMQKEQLKLDRYMKQYEFIKKVFHNSKIIEWFRIRANKQNDKAQLWQEKWTKAGRLNYWINTIDDRSGHQEHETI